MSRPSNLVNKPTTLTRDSFDPEYIIKREQVFWSKIKITPNGCWEWQGSRTSAGYGKFHFDGIKRRTHRMAMLFIHGKVPAGMSVMHSCDNPSCVYPGHLSFGTHQQNMDDKRIKGRANSAKGELNGKSKLSNVQAKEIRNLYSTDNITQEKIGRMFNVSVGTINGIIHQRTYK